jgi:hypothetical protein
MPNKSQKATASVIHFYLCVCVCVRARACVLIYMYVVCTRIYPDKDGGCHRNISEYKLDCVYV